MVGQFFFDRVRILIDGVAYLPNGQIRSFGMNASYASSQQRGFTPDGTPAGQIVGGSVIDSVSWTEYLPTQANYLNWRTFLIANPTSVLTIIPVSLVTGLPTDNTPPQFTIAGINCTGQNFTAAGESEPCMRACTFNASTSSNL